MIAIEGKRINGRTVVEVRRGSGSEPLRHHVKHSPTGLEWGYGGSGPADLARSILIEILGPRAICRACGGARLLVWDEAIQEHRAPRSPEELDAARAPRGDGGRDDPANADLVVACHLCDAGVRRDLPYMEFKFEIVARLPRAGFTLPVSDVEAWLSTHPIGADA